MVDELQENLHRGTRELAKSNPATPRAVDGHDERPLLGVFIWPGLSYAHPCKRLAEFAVTLFKPDAALIDVEEERTRDANNA